MERYLSVAPVIYDLIDKDMAGGFRKEQVFISGSKYPVCLPEEIETKMQDLCEWMSKDRGKLHPIEFVA